MGGDSDVIVRSLEHLYPRENISVFEDVNKDEYWDILANNTFDYLAFRSHSDSEGHTLEDDTRWYAVEYMQVNANVNFFELAACSTGSMVGEQQMDPYDPDSPKTLFLVSDLLAWNIQFAKSGGLIVLAPSIRGDMRYPAEMYDHLRNGGTFGRAFRFWGKYMASAANSHPTGWAFILFFGDPFIRFDLPNYYCILYTSLVGTEQEEKIEIMRIWRDAVFKKNRIGRLLVSSFYRISPLFSKMVLHSKILRMLNRWFFLGILKLFEITPWNRIVKKFIAEKKQTAIDNPPIALDTECKICRKQIKK